VGIWSRFRFPLIVAALLLGSLILFSLHAGRDYQSTIAGRLLLEIVGPMQGAVTAVGEAVENVWDTYFALVHTAKTNQDLKRELASLRQDLVRLDELDQANQRLRSLLGLRKELPYPQLAAEVVASDPSDHFRTVIINKGTKDGVTTNKPVVHPQGVVGRIIWASPHYAKVLLLTDPNSGADVIVQRSRARGVVQGMDKDRLRLKYVQRAQDVAVGDRIITSGVAGVFPPGILIGEVRKVDEEGRGIFQRVEVAPAVDFERLEEVVVLLYQRDFND
jgi:rod shape-determining protein MreC